MLFEALAVLPLVCLLGLFLSGNKPTLHGAYSQPGRWFPLKWLLMRCLLWRRRRQQNISGAQSADGGRGYGQKSHDSVDDMEMPQVLEHDPMALDGMYFNGLHKDGTFFILRIGRRHNRRAETWLSIKIPGIGFFQSTVHPDTSVYNTDDTSFNAAGLKFECIEPMKKWRITYNGLLREGMCNDYSNRDFKTKHVAFSFIWNALTDVFDFDTDIAPGALATAVAREPWTREFWDTLKNQHQTHYEQWGELRGWIKVQGHEDTTLRLRGCRDHSYGIRDWRMFHRYIVVFGYVENGITFHVHTVSWSKGLTYLQCGYLSFPNATMVPVTSVDMDLTDIGENGSPPERFSFKFTAGGRVFSVAVQSEFCPVYYHLDDWGNVIYENCCRITVNGVKGQAVAEFLYRRENSRSPVPQLDSYPLLQAPETIPPHDKGAFILPFSKPSCSRADVVGGKGCQLALLTQLTSKNFVVPNGFCLTLSAFEAQLKNSKDLASQIADLVSVASGQKEGTLQQVCESVSSSIATSELCAEVQDAVVKQLDMQFSEHFPETRFAVRSSAAGEDSEEMSAAGQMDTFLGVAGQDEIFKAICKCWASQFAPIAVEYRRQHGQPIQCGMGIVIQEMVEAQAAGVLFTRHPVTGSPAQMVINANYGLGESVVSGQTEPDTVTVSRTWDDQLTISEKQLGGKNIQIRLSVTGGTETVENTPGADSVCSVSDSVILRLAAIGVELEKRFSDPRDIEWAVKGDKIYILQARPITALDQETEEEMLHEFDSPLIIDKEVLTTCNIGEMMPAAMTPLTISVFHRSIDLCGQEYERRAGAIPRNHEHIWKFTGICANSPLINMHFVEGCCGGHVLGHNKRMAELALMGETLDDLTDEEIDSYNGTSSLPRRLYNAIKCQRNLSSSLSRIQKYPKFLETFTFVDKSWRSSLELYRDIDTNIHVYRKAWSDSFTLSAASGFWANVVIGVLSQGKAEWTTEHYSDMAMILSNCENVYSADVPTAIRGLAATIHASGQAEHFVKLSAQEAVEWLQSERSGHAGQEFSSFMKRHGHRCVKEADFLEKSWQTEPHKVTSVLQAMLTSGAKVIDHKTPVISTAEALAKIKTPITATARLALKWIIPKARKGVGQREWGKSLAVQVGEVFKRGYWKLAQMMVKEGRLPKDELLFFLTHREIGVLLETRSGRLVARAQRRRKIFPQQLAIQLPRISRGYPTVIVENGAEDDFVITSLKLEGMPVSHGIARGKARVVRKLADAASIQQGEVLIVPFTDIGWSPYFPLISGLVTEIGGLVSHGAVVAREYGIPCVVKVQRATSLFKTGDMVVLNGSKGTLEKIEETSDTLR